MSTILTQETGGISPIGIPRVKDLRVGIVVARWNNHITDALLEGALSTLESLGYPRKDHVVLRVPGSIELVHAAALLLEDDNVDAIIMIGCVIRGGTPHFDYVCDNATQGCAMLNATQEVPIIFCVLTTDDEQQALDRAGGALCNKGTEAAEAAIEMEALARQYGATSYHDNPLSRAKIHTVRTGE